MNRPTSDPGTARQTDTPAKGLGAPATEYQRRLHARETEVTDLVAREGHLANLRLVLFLAASAGVWLLRNRLPIAVLLLIPGLGFAVLLLLHDRTKRRLTRARRVVEHYRRGLARLAYDFAGTGVPGDPWADETHPYAVHLDLFGTGSVFELLCGARTPAGQETLAGWLLEAADAEVIRGRQAAASELSPGLDLREDFAAFDPVVVEALGSTEPEEWGEGPPRLPGKLWRATSLALGSAAAGAALTFPWIGATPLAWLLLAELALWLGLRRRVETVLEAVERPAAALRLVLAVLERLEREHFSSPALTRIDAVLGASRPRPSERLRKLLWRIDAMEWRENQLFLPIALAVSWGTNWAFAIERWRLEHGPEIGGWIRAVGEVEALLDLGRYTYERPGNTFPRIVEEAAVFHAEGLIHPLLRDGSPNDVSLDGTHRLLIVTGSNMSGKSTLLRTVGVNAVLGLSGAPVRAGSMELTVLSVGASIRTVDSLQDGASRFYAEIRAIKRAMDVAEAHPPGLFLLDELLHGTNSHDRKIGAESIVRGFLARGALGIVTTHDLALATVAGDLGERASNAHFEFALEGDRIRFDYTLRPGVVKTGNALEIMRAAGLEI